MCVRLIWCDILGSDGGDNAGYCLLRCCVFWHVTYNLVYIYICTEVSEERDSPFLKLKLVT
jgi:hypothetical protein